MSLPALTPLAPIVYGDDDENDVFFIRRAFKKVGLENPLLVARHGRQVLDLLHAVQESPPATRPALAILDLKMPIFSGIDVVRWARQQPDLKDFPILLLTSSTQESDLRQAYEAGANAYLVKPSDPERLIGIVREIQAACLQQPPNRGWLNLPSNHPPPSAQPPQNPRNENRGVRTPQPGG